MNDLEQLRERLANRFPDALLAIDVPAADNGTWFLDVRLQGHLVVLQWRADRGFGVSTPSKDDRGAKPDELYAIAEAAYKRIVELLLSQTRTVPGLTSQTLRDSCQLYQAEIANRLQITGTA